MRNGFSFKCRKETVLQELCGRHEVDIVAVSEWGQPDIKDIERLTKAGWTVVEKTRHERSCQKTRAPGDHRGGTALLFRTSKYDVAEVKMQDQHDGLQIAMATARLKTRPSSRIEGFAACYPTQMPANLR